MVQQRTRMPLAQNCFWDEALFVDVVRNAAGAVVLDAVKDARDAERLDVELDGKSNEGTAVDSLHWLPSQASERPEEPVRLRELLGGRLVEPDRHVRWEYAVDTEEAVLDLLELVQHGQDHFLPQV